MKYQFKPESKFTILKEEDSIIKIEGFSGFVSLNGLKYTIKSVFIIGPSFHKFVGEQYDMEMQILCENNSKHLTFVSFVKSQRSVKNNSFMVGLGFGTGSLKSMPIGGTKIVQGMTIEGDIISQNQKRFLLYHGENYSDGCD